MQTALVTPTYETRQHARKQFADYQALAKSGRSTAADEVAQEVYRQVLRGRTLLSLSASLRMAGVDARGRPKLAITRADARWCFFRRSAGIKSHTDGSGIAVSEFLGDIRQSAPSADWYRAGRHHGRGLSVLVPQELFPIALDRELRAMVPPIPPALRPRANLQRYHILWEAEWQSAPYDPLLLRRLSTDWFVVLAQWDLSEVERQVLAAASYAEAY